MWTPLAHHRLAMLVDTGMRIAKACTPRSNNCRRGLARLLMETIHQWCRNAGYPVVGLAASQKGKPLYESLGYTESHSPYMFVVL